MKAALLKIVKEQPNIEGTTTRNGNILTWVKDGPDTPVYLETPDDLLKIDIATPDWKKTKA